MTGVGILGSKFTTIIVSLIYVPAAYNQLGPELFGILETLISLIPIFAFLEFGLTYGLQNNLASSTPNKATKNEREATTTVFTLLTGTALISVTIYFTTYEYINWKAILNTTPQAAATAQKAATWLFVILAIQLPFGIVQRVRLAHQEGHINTIWNSLSNIIGLILSLLALQQQFAPHYIIIAIYGTQTSCIGLNFATKFLKSNSTISFKQVRLQQASLHYKSGFTFLYLQSANLLLNAFDRLLLTQAYGPTAVATYSIIRRICGLFSTPIDAFSLPTLPAISNAIANNDHTWARMYIKKTFRILVPTSAFLAVLASLSSNTILKIWINENESFEIIMLLSIGTFIMYSCFNSYISYIAMTPSTIKSIIKPYSIASILTLALKTITVQQFGIEGLLMSTTIIMTAAFLYPTYKIISTI